MKLNTLLFISAFTSTYAMAEQRFVIPVRIQGQLTGYNVDTQRAQLEISALSGGCLSKDNFEVQQLETLPPQVSIVQTSIDGCEAMVGPTTLVYSFEELGIGKNSIQVSTKSTVGLSK